MAWSLYSANCMGRIRNRANLSSAPSGSRGFKPAMWPTRVRLDRMKASKHHQEHRLSASGASRRWSYPHGMRLDHCVELLQLTRPQSVDDNRPLVHRHPTPASRIGGAHRSVPSADAAGRMSRRSPQTRRHHVASCPRRISDVVGGKDSLLEGRPGHQNTAFVLEGSADPTVDRCDAAVSATARTRLVGHSYRVYEVVADQRLRQVEQVGE